MIMSFRIDDILRKEDGPKKKRVADGEILHKALVCSRDDPVWRRKNDADVLKNFEEKYYLYYRNLFYGQKVYLPTFISNSYKSFNFHAHSNHQHFPYMKFTSCKRKGGQIRFSAAQTDILEKRFRAHKYLSPEERKLLADALNLSDRQVKTWFQNRRAKWRRLHNQSVILDEINKEEIDSRNISDVSNNKSMKCSHSDEGNVK